MDQFITRLRKQAENCNKQKVDELIHGQVIDKCRSSELLRKLTTRETDLPIAKFKEIACSFEAVDIQLIAMLA